MTTLQEKLAQILPAYREEVLALEKQHGEVKLADVTVGQAYGGMRGVLAMVCDTSVVEPDKGLIVRGRPIGELEDRLPEEIWYLLLTGSLPDQDGLAALQRDLQARSEVPAYVWDVLQAMPKDSHPMCMLNTAVLVMERESVFRKQYDAGMTKNDYWKPMLEDSLILLARLPNVAAGIYRMRYGKGKRLAPDPKLDWSTNFARMLGLADPTKEFANLVRLYLTLHCDHEGGNVSAFTCHTVGSALSDVYYSVSAGLDGLAGPLHGLANQECLKFVLELQEKFKGVPSDADLTKFSEETLKTKVIPGYGHAVLRVTDPRFSAFHKFGKRVCAQDPIFGIVDRLFAVVPEVLKKQGKAKNPWPNVDAGSGCLLYYFGIKEFDYYTVFFSVSRALGLTAQLILNRAIGAPITRPKSLSTEQMKEQVKGKT